MPVFGGVPTFANNSLIEFFGLGGADLIALDEANGPLPSARFDGGRGNDTMIGGSGDDSFIWLPGDGSDTIEGGGGVDTLVFEGADANEVVEVLAAGEGVHFFRAPGNIFDGPCRR